MTVNSLEDSFQTLREQVYTRMLQRKRSKYQWFLRALRSYKHFAPIQGDLLEAVYVCMREIDDIVDGDLPTLEPREEYVQQRMRFATTQNNPLTLTDHTLSYAFHLADQLNLDIHEEIQSILGSLLFDARRVGKHLTFSRPNLDEHFHFLDIKGTIYGALKLMGEDPQKFPLLKALGKASRIHYDLRDYEEDVQAGYINIPQEDLALHHISPANLESKLSLGVRSWFLQQAQTGLSLLEQHSTVMNLHSFSPHTTLALPLVYALPAQRYFKRILNTTTEPNLQS